MCLIVREREHMETCFVDANFANMGARTFPLKAVSRLFRENAILLPPKKANPSNFGATPANVSRRRAEGAQTRTNPLGRPILRKPSYKFVEFAADRAGVEVGG